MTQSLTLGKGLTIGKGITFGAGAGGGGGGGPPTVDPATNTGGISLAVIAGLPKNLYPGISVFDGGSNAKFIINPASTYGTPAGFTFLSSWSWTLFDPTYVGVTTTNTANDTATALFNANNAVLGSVAIAASTKRMFSVTHTTWSGGADQDGVGVGSGTTGYTGFNKWLGLDNQAVSIFDGGGVWTNNGQAGSGYAVFETNGQIIDVAVDTVNNKMWYRVAGGAWQG
jgi:hypothetical protein